MITLREVSQRAFQEKMSDRVIEKDYVLTWILMALADSPLAELLAFKGGTALKKIYFPGYRYSEDPWCLTIVGTRETDSSPHSQCTRRRTPPPPLSISGSCGR